MIKLFKISEAPNLIRLQSQLNIGKNVADFIIEDGILKNYFNGRFVEYKEPYQIVENKTEMMLQKL